ncbi:MAG: toll/interleukin-1 receptor domain-containing protein [Burkholderiales bacterium]
MADIFVSYARADQDFARSIADAFRAMEWSVWWDRELLYGKAFDEEIEKALDQAKCVVVLWSKTSVASGWVLTEAHRAIGRRVLVPVLIDAESKIPLEFERLHHVELTEWEGDQTDSRFQGLAGQIGQIIRAHADPTSTEKKSPDGSGDRIRTHRRTLTRVLWLIAPTAIGIVAAIAAMQIHRPTDVEIELLFKGLTVVSAADRDVLLTERSAVERFSVHGVEHGIVSASRMIVAGDEGDFTKGVALAGLSIAQAPMVKVDGSAMKGAAITIEGTGNTPSVIGTLDSLYIPSQARTKLSIVPGPRPELAVHSAGKPAGVLVSLTAESFVHISGAAIDAPAPTSLKRDRASFRVMSGGAGASVDVKKTVIDGATVQMIPRDPARFFRSDALNLRIASLDFESQGRNNERVSTVVGAGRIAYSDAEGLKPIEVNKDHFVVLRAIDRGDRAFYLRRLQYVAGPDLESAMIHVTAGGSVASLVSGPAGAIRGRTLTWFDYASHQPLWAQLLALVGLVFPTTVAGWKLWKELKT